MALDTVRANPNLAPDVRDDIEDTKKHAVRRYVSPWTRIDAAASATFQHGLGEIPYVADVLEATDSQGTGEAAAATITVTKTGTLVTVANGGAARFFRVRAT